MIKYDFKNNNYFENNYLDFDKCNSKLNEYDMIGWTNNITINPDIEKMVTKVKRNSSILVVVGIGGSTGKTFENFDEFKWLEKNAYKYGFILRYPKDKEYLTGYEYESWHFRYVGKNAAKYIHENKITFDEYYAYFIEGKNEKEKKD